MRWARYGKSDGIRVTYYPLSCTLSRRVTLFSPFGTGAASDAGDDPLLFEFTQQVPDHIAANIRAEAFQVRDTEIGCQGLQSQLDQLGLFAARGGDLAGAFLKFVVGFLDDEEQVVVVATGA